ncbi:MAG: hypothetical protein ACRC7D_22355 [Aeromonas popoffii]|uniref:hypothetical protein n=1 Tax=Aeromonas popoffii TaxID=70856 RepID=UPI003F3F9F0C
MNDKQQLAAMGDELRLTEDQAKGLAERMPQTGTLQILDDEPMCMAKRIEELEAQLAQKVITIERLREMNVIVMKRVDGMLNRDLELSRLQSLMQEGWQLVPARITAEMWDAMSSCHQSPVCWWNAALAAAPKPEAK